MVYVIILLITTALINARRLLWEIMRAMRAEIYILVGWEANQITQRDEALHCLIGNAEQIFSRESQSCGSRELIPISCGTAVTALPGL